MHRYLTISLLFAASMFGQTPLDKLVGPVTALGTSPWPYYDIAEQGNADQITAEALAYPPLEGAAISCTVTMNNTAPVTLTAASSGCANEVKGVPVLLVTTTNPIIVTFAATPAWVADGYIMGFRNIVGCSTLNRYINVISHTATTATLNADGAACGSYTPSSGEAFDQLLVAWNSVDGTGTGRMYLIPASVSGTTITASSGAGLAPQISGTTLTGLTVYHCLRCDGDTPHYGIGSWGFAGAWDNGYNFYDMGMALYRLYLRTGTTAYLTAFRNTTDIWFKWALKSAGYENVGTPRAASILSQFVRMLDPGDPQPQRFAPMYTMIQNNFTFHNQVFPDGFDNREPGYMLLFAAAGSIADPDATRHAAYCTMTSDAANLWITSYAANGSLHYFPEKPGPYPYTTGGVSPWRQFATFQGLALAYDSFADTSAAGCNNTTLATNILNLLKDTVPWAYTLGHDSVTRGIYYDVNFVANGLNGRDVLGPQHGTVDVTLDSPSVVGHSSQFLTDYNCNGTDYFGAETAPGSVWTHLVASCTDDTHLTLATNWGTQCVNSYATGSLIVICGVTATGQTPYKANPYSTSCNSDATNCPTAGDINSDRDLVWIMGWMYKTTGLSAYQTYGNELLAVSSGGPASGPGAMDACSGPSCSSTETDYIQSLRGCAFINVVPCNSSNNNTCKVGTDGGCEDPNPCPTTGCFNQAPVFYRSKRYAQMSGIGGADNSLSWLAGTSAPDILTTCPLTSGTVGVAYSITLTAAGTTPITWSITSGTLPTGLSLNTSTGAITGTPTVATTATLTIQADNSVGMDSKPSCGLTIAASGSVGNGGSIFSGKRVSAGKRSTN